MERISVSSFSAALVGVIFVICALVGLWRLRVILSNRGGYRMETRHAMVGLVLMCLTLASIATWAFVNHQAIMAARYVGHNLSIFITFRVLMAVSAMIIVRAWTYEQCRERGWLTLLGISIIGAIAADLTF